MDPSSPERMEASPPTSPMDQAPMDPGYPDPAEQGPSDAAPADAAPEDEAPEDPYKVDLTYPALIDPSAPIQSGSGGPRVVKAGKPRHVYAVRESLLETAAVYAQEDLDKTIEKGEDSDEAKKNFIVAKEMLDSHRALFGTYHNQIPCIEFAKELSSMFEKQDPAQPGPMPKRSPAKRDSRGQSLALKKDLAKGMEALVRKGAQENLDQFDKIVRDYFTRRTIIVAKWNQAKSAVRRTEMQNAFKGIVREQHIRLEALYAIFEHLGPEIQNVYMIKLDEMFDRENEMVEREFQAYGPAAVWFFMNQRERQEESREEHQTKQPKGQRRKGGAPQWF